MNLDFLRDIYEIFKLAKNTCKREYNFQKINPISYFDDLVQISLSTSIRKGKPFTSLYKNSKLFWEYLISQNTAFYAVIDNNGKCRAYAELINVGEVGILTKIMGHYSSLKDGIMWFWVANIVKHIVTNKEDYKELRYLMYNIFYSASPGLRCFKRKLGFKPYKVMWRWTP